MLQTKQHEKLRLVVNEVLLASHELEQAVVVYGIPALRALLEPVPALLRSAGMGRGRDMLHKLPHGQTEFPLTMILRR